MQIPHRLRSTLLSRTSDLQGIPCPLHSTLLSRTSELQGIPYPLRSTCLSRTSDLNAFVRKKKKRQREMAKPACVVRSNDVFLLPGCTGMFCLLVVPKCDLQLLHTRNLMAMGIWCDRFLTIKTPNKEAKSEKIPMTGPPAGCRGHAHRRSGAVSTISLSSLGCSTSI